MTGFVKKDVIDGMATAMLALGCSMKLNAPTWIIKEMLTRKTDPVKPAKIFGVRNARLRPSLVDEYLDKIGYQYSWGAVSEDLYSEDFDFEDGEDGEKLVVRFEFYPEEILKEFPNPAMVQDLMIRMYEYHPSMDENYVVDEARGDWFVLAFEAIGVEEISNLRDYLAKNVIPKIWPDLFTNGMRIVKEAKAAELARTNNQSFEGALIETRRWQLCGDMKDLSFSPK